MRELLGGAKEKSVLQRGVINLSLRQINDFLTNLDNHIRLLQV